MTKSRLRTPGARHAMAPFFLVDITGRQYEPPVAYLRFFYGFLSVAMAWQVAFLVIGSNPSRFRALMIPSMIEKFGYVAILAVLYSRALVPVADAAAAIPDCLLGILFLISFVKTSKAGSA